MIRYAEIDSMDDVPNSVPKLIKTKTKQLNMHDNPKNLLEKEAIVDPREVDMSEIGDAKVVHNTPKQTGTYEDNELSTSLGFGNIEIEERQPEKQSTEEIDYAKADAELTNQMYENRQKAIASTPETVKQGTTDLTPSHSNPNKLCTKCGGTGYSMESGKLAPYCRECGKGAVGLSESGMTASEVEILDLKIPEQYKRVGFNKGTLKASHLNKQNDRTFNVYLDTLETAYSTLSAGRKLNYSYLVHAPQGYGKQYWAYACMQAAASAGLSSVPYLDIEEWDNLMDAYRYGKYDSSILKNVKPFELDDFYNADIAFVKIPTGVLDKRHTQLMSVILDRRARRGNSTIFISRFSLQYILLSNPEIKNCFTDSHATVKNLYYVPYADTQTARQDRSELVNSTRNNNKYNK